MRWTPRFLLAVFILASLVAYLPVFNNGFRRDDFAFLEQMVEHGGSWRVLAPTYRFAFVRPGAVAMFHVEYSLFGMHSAPYLIVNYLLHLAVALAGLRVLRRLDVGEWAAVLGVGLFLLGFGHYGKTVIWAASAGTVVATLLCVLAIDLASGPLETAGEKATLAAMVLIAPSFHEIGILAAGLALLRSTYARDAARKWCLLWVLVSAAAWSITWVLASRVYEGYAAAAHAFPQAPLQLARYLSLLVLPVGGGVDASAGVQRLLTMISGSRLPVGIAMLGGLGYLAYRARSSRFLILWTLISLLPFTVIGLPGEGLQLRYTYPAALPWCALAAFLLVRLPARTASTLAVTIAAYSVSIHLLIAQHYDRSTNSPLNRALRDELRQLQEHVSQDAQTRQTGPDS